MKARIIPILIVLAALGTSISLTTPLHEMRASHDREEISGLGRLPSPLLKAAVLEFKGVTSDLLMLKTITYVGMKLMARTRLTPEEWHKVTSMLRGITDLDPRFSDPYLFAEAMFPWQANRRMLGAADALLLKAVKHRPDDYEPLYFLGFNAFYFEHDAIKAAPYLRRAALLPGAPGFLKGLAARFSVYSDQTALGILFLRDLLKNTHGQRMRSYLGERLALLKILYFLEQKTKQYQSRFGRRPSSLQELVAKGLLDKIPADPYGGHFVLLKNGRVYTTSNMIEEKKGKRAKTAN